jgi:tight adherence protein C
MLFVVLGLVAFAVFAAVLFVVELVPSRSSAIAARLDELRDATGTLPDMIRRRRRQLQSRRLSGIIRALGEKVELGRRDVGALRLQLIQAGYPSPTAVPLYLGSRVGVPVALAFGIFSLLSLFGVRPAPAILTAVWLGLVGYLLPAVFVNSRIRQRQREMQRALPDALDLFVVCVEAGLGLNQAVARVGDEIERLSPVLSEQLGLTHLEMRAGTPRDEAFRSMGERTGLTDIKTLMAMLIQTDRFGTSIAQALRTHADTMRTKRRQRAEELAAKTTIKLLFPLVLLIFPALFTIILGPAVIQVIETLGNFR